ncbi:6-bladed beta-propeller [Chloroflexota bacterium]
MKKILQRFMGRKFFLAGSLMKLSVLLVLVMSLVATPALAAGPSIIDLAADPYAFNSDTGSTTVNYTLNDVTDAPVVLEIYNSGDILVRSIDAGLQSSGAYSIAWDGNDESAVPVAEGLYTARLNVTTGDGDGVPMNQARYLDTSQNGYVYVVDGNNNRILKFDTEGNFITKWGVQGSGDGQLWGPSGISVDSDGYVYVSDHYNSRIQKFDADGVYLSQFGTPWGIMGNQVDSSGKVYVADHFNNWVLKYQPDGTLDTSWSCSGNPWDVALDSEDNVYVTAHWGYAVRKFTSAGVLLKSWGSNGGRPGDLTIDSNDNVFVSDYSNHRVNVFDSDGVLITRLGTYGDGDGQFKYPFGLAFDQAGNLYVADAGNSRIQKFSEDYTFILEWGYDSATTTSITAETDILVDNAAPTISVSVSPDTLWAPNHKMVEITATVDVGDIYDLEPTVVLTSIESNEPDNGKGNDIEGAEFGTEDYTFLLQAERDGSGDGRIYTITYTVTDAAGNSAIGVAIVTVPHDQGEKQREREREREEIGKK